MLKKIQFVIQTLRKLTKLSLSSRFISAGLKSNRALQSAAGWDGWRCSTRGVWLAATNTPSPPSLPGYLFSTFCFMVMLGLEGSSVPPNEPACRFRLGALTESWNRHKSTCFGWFYINHNHMTPVLWLYSCLVLLLHHKTTDFSELLMDFCSTERDVYCSCRCRGHQTLIESGHLSVNTAAVTAKRKFIICWHYWILKLNLLTELKMEMTSGFHSGGWWRGMDRHRQGQNKSIIRELTDFCTSAHNLDTQLCWCLRCVSNLFGIVNQWAGLFM